MTRFSPAQAYWNQRGAVAAARDRIRALCEAVDYRGDLTLYQWAQLMSAVMEFQPDVVLELGRGKGNSTCAFTEASHLTGGKMRVLSLCRSKSWEEETLPRLRQVVAEDWFVPLRALRTDILQFDYAAALADARRILIFWDAHGFDVAECVLGGILPLVAEREHAVIMHDMSDNRNLSDREMEYGNYGLWKGNNWSGPRLKLGTIDSAVEQCISAVDFTTRNRLTLDSADHSIQTELSEAQHEEMRNVLGREFFDTQANWFYFSLNEHAGPYKFPRFERPAATGLRKAPSLLQVILHRLRLAR